MIGVSVNQAKNLFFDRASVTSAMDRAERRALSKFGAFVRKSARQSIVKRKRPAKPGSPPRNRTGRLKRNIFFVYDRTHRSVIIGPALLGHSSGAPRVLEHGGAVVLRRGRKRKRVMYQPRPYMGPAGRKELPKLPAMWRDSVTA